MRRVFITGSGSVSPFGVGVSTLLQGLKDRRSAVVDMSAEWEPLVHDLVGMVGAPCTEPLGEKRIPRKYRKTMGRAALMAYVAAAEAIEGAGLPEEIWMSGRAGVSFGSSTGSTESILEAMFEVFETGEKRNLNSGTFFRIMSHTAAANLAQCFNIRGRVIAPNCACSSASQAIGLAYEMIKEGRQQVMLCGGCDELHVTTNAIFDLIQAASFKYNDRPEETPRPFDKDRDGTVCADGAGCVILESEESARSRGARLLGEVIGFNTISSGTHIANADTESIAHCIRSALDDAGLRPADIDYVNAHATGTQIGDAGEAGALRDVFGSKAPPVSSLKGNIGHTLGASGAVELIALLDMMENDAILPIKNLEEPGEECKGLDYVTTPRSVQLNVCMKNSFAFGGINTVLIVGKADRS